MTEPTIQILAVAGTMLPAFVYGIDTARESRNIVHPILGSSLSDVTLRPASLRSGTLTLAFTGDTADADSLRAMDIHAGGNVLTLVYTDMASANMSYVATGRVTREPESATRGAWLVSVEYQEVSA